MLLKETHFKYRHRQQAVHIESKKESKKLVWLILKQTSRITRKTEILYG